MSSGLELFSFNVNELEAEKIDVDVRQEKNNQLNLKKLMIH